MPSPYDILAVHVDATDGEIDTAYRQRVKETHPDLGGTADELRQVIAAYKAIKSDEETVDIETVSHSSTPASYGVTRVEYLNYDVLTDHNLHIDDDDLFEHVAELDLDTKDHGELTVHPHESLLVAAERCGYAWPFACRGGACANCAVIVKTGDLALPPDHILPEEMTDRGIRLSCNGIPTNRDLQVVYNVKHRPDLDDLRLPPYPFERAHPNG